MTYISDIDGDTPTGLDFVKNGDDQIRALKKDLYNTLGGLDGEIFEDADTAGDNGTVPLSAQVMNSWEARIKALEALATSPDGTSVPVGGIVTWYGPSSTIPVGWAKCDGSTHEYTDGAGDLQSITLPDLRGRFVMGPEWSTTVQGDTGGLRYTDNVQERLTDSVGNHTHSTTTPQMTLSVDQIPSHSHPMFSDQATAVGGTPPAPGFAYVAFRNTNSGGPYAYSVTASSSAADTGISGTQGAGGSHFHPSTNSGSAGSHNHNFNATQPFVALYFIAYVAG